MKNKTKEEILSSVKRTYSLIAEDFSNTRKNNWQEFELFLNHIKENDHILDLGCGNGRLFQFLKNKKNIKYTGIDNNEFLLKEAQKIHKNSSAKFIQGDLLKIPIESQKADVIASIASFHHIPSKELREKSLKEMDRILKKDGKLIMTVWNLLNIKKYKKEVKEAKLRWLKTLGKYEKRGLFIPWGKEKIPRYYYAFKEKELEKLLKNHFIIIEKKVDKNLIYICEKK